MTINTTDKKLEIVTADTAATINGKFEFKIGKLTRQTRHRTETFEDVSVSLIIDSDMECDSAPAMSALFGLITDLAKTKFVTETEERVEPFHPEPVSTEPEFVEQPPVSDCSEELRSKVENILHSYYYNSREKFQLSSVQELPCAVTLDWYHRGELRGAVIYRHGENLILDADNIVRGQNLDHLPVREVRLIEALFSLV